MQRLGIDRKFTWIWFECAQKSNWSPFLLYRGLETFDRANYEAEINLRQGWSNDRT